MVEEPAPFAHSSHRQRLEGKALEYTLWVHTVLELLHVPSTSLHCHVCPFVTGAQARPVLLRPTAFLFPFESVHCMRLLLCSRH